MKEIFIKNQSGILKAIKIILYLTLLTPLIVNSNFLFPYVFGKAIFFEALIEIALILFLGILIFTDFKIQVDKFSIVIFIWVLVIFLSGVFGVDFYNSFFSKAERMTGIFWYLHLVAFFIMLIAIFSKNEKSWLNFLKANSIISLAIGLSAILTTPNLFSGSFLNIRDRLGGSFGNPSFLATYFVIIVFLNILLFIKSQNKEKYFWGFSGVFSLIMVFISGTRGAYVGLISGMLVFIVLTLIKSKQFRKTALIILAGFVLLALSFVIFRDFWMKASPAISARVYSITELPLPRLIVWKMGFEGFLARPIFGWGGENFIYVFNKFFNPELFLYERAIFDRPHNRLVEIAVNNGIIGLISYLSIFGFLAYKILKEIFNKNQFNQVLLASLASVAGLFTAYFVQDLVLFEMPTSGIMFFEFLAFSWFFVFNNPEFRSNNLSETKNNSQFNKTFNLNFKKLKEPIYVIAILIVVCSFYFGILKPVNASQNLIKSIAYVNTSQENYLKTGFDFYQKARKADTFLNKEIDINTSRRLRTSFNNTLALATTSQEMLIDFGSSLFENLLIDGKKHKNDYDSLVEAGSLSFYLKGLGIETKPNFEEIKSQAVLRSPKRVDIYENAFSFYFASDDKEKALENLNYLNNLGVKLSEFYFFNGIYEARWGDFEKAKENLRLAKENNYYVSNLALQQVVLNDFGSKGEFNKQIEYLDLLIELANDVNEQAIWKMIKVDLLIRSGQIQEGENLLKELLAQYPKEADQKIILEFLQSRGMEINL